jgi:hypothetical protein
MIINYESVVSAIKKAVEQAEKEGRSIESIKLDEHEWSDLLRVCRKDPNRTSVLSYRGVKIMRDTTVWNYVSPTRVDSVDL